MLQKLVIEILSLDKGKTEMYVKYGYFISQLNLFELLVAEVNLRMRYLLCYEYFF